MGIPKTDHTVKDCKHSRTGVDNSSSNLRVGSRVTGNHCCIWKSQHHLPLGSSVRGALSLSNWPKCKISVSIM